MQQPLLIVFFLVQKAVHFAAGPQKSSYTEISGRLSIYNLPRKSFSPIGCTYPTAPSGCKATVERYAQAFWTAGK